jgi:hypothetical protein
VKPFKKSGFSQVNSVRPKIPCLISGEKASVLTKECFHFGWDSRHKITTRAAKVVVKIEATVGSPSNNHMVLTRTISRKIVDVKKSCVMIDGGIERQCSKSARNRSPIVDSTARMPLGRVVFVVTASL